MLSGPQTLFKWSFATESILHWRLSVSVYVYTVELKRSQLLHQFLTVNPFGNNAKETPCVHFWVLLIDSS